MINYIQLHVLMPSALLEKRETGMSHFWYSTSRLLINMRMLNMHTLFSLLLQGHAACTELVLATIRTLAVRSAPRGFRKVRCTGDWEEVHPQADRPAEVMRQFLEN